MTKSRPLNDDEEFGDLLRDAALYYTARLLERGEGAEGMDWRDRASQHLRFERLLAHLPPSPGDSLLDVGCGSGELLAFCRARGWKPEYVGIDVSEEMVAACNRRFGAGSAATTTLAQLIREGRRFDLVLASGTFNVRQLTPHDEWRRYFHHSVTEMFALARRGAAFNIMSSRVDYRHDHLYYAQVDEMAKLADACGTRDFVVDHGYPLYEMTVTLFAREAERR
ncbi:MAG TPA: class I SAM-dependent methyltransferase [Thermoanaerobaculia bacterium]|nr:class I SAM-dependent methyltransferase [Thermoanaerobaculia bacterium]